MKEVIFRMNKTFSFIVSAVVEHSSSAKKEDVYLLLKTYQ